MIIPFNLGYYNDAAGTTPAGWALCNGLNGRFVLADCNGRTEDATGGEETHYYLLVKCHHTITVD